MQQNVTDFWFLRRTMNQYGQHLQMVFPFLTKDEFFFLKTFVLFLLTNVFEDESMACVSSWPLQLRGTPVGSPHKTSSQPSLILGSSCLAWWRWDSWWSKMPSSSFGGIFCVLTWTRFWWLWLEPFSIIPSINSRFIAKNTCDNYEWRISSMLLLIVY